MSVEKISLLVGSPGSGKSTLGLKMQNQGLDCLFLDDISIQIKSSPCDFIYEQAISKNKTHIIIADVNFCFSQIRDSAVFQLEKFFNLTVDIIYFENNLEKCLKNIKKRQLEGDDRKVIELAQLIFRKYNIPHDITPILIYQQDE